MNLHLYVYRDNCDVLFDKCCENSIPVVVISAGVGDVIALMLKKWLKDITIASNFLKFDGHKLLGFKLPVISIVNKNTVIVAVSYTHLDVYKRQELRHGL